MSIEGDFLCYDLEGSGWKRTGTATWRKTYAWGLHGVWLSDQQKGLLILNDRVVHNQTAEEWPAVNCVFPRLDAEAERYLRWANRALAAQNEKGD